MRTGKILSVRNRRLSLAGLVAVVFALVCGAENGPAGVPAATSPSARSPAGQPAAGNSTGPGGIQPEGCTK